MAAPAKKGITPFPSPVFCFSISAADRDCLATRSLFASPLPQRIKLGLLLSQAGWKSQECRFAWKKLNVIVNSVRLYHPCVTRGYRLAAVSNTRGQNRVRVQHRFCTRRSELLWTRVLGFDERNHTIPISIACSAVAACFKSRHSASHASPLPMRTAARGSEIGRAHV